MEEDIIWRLIEHSRERSHGDLTQQLNVLYEQLSIMTNQELQDFDLAVRRLLDSAYRWDLWGAIYLKEGGCFDDSFSAACSWLILQGKTTFYRALTDTDIVISKGVQFCDGLLATIGNAYTHKFNEDLPVHFVGSEHPRGDKWFSIEELRIRFPKTAATCSPVVRLPTNG
jgi:hypothetical protein